MYQISKKKIAALGLAQPYRLSLIEGLCKTASSVVPELGSPFEIRIAV